MKSKKYSKILIIPDNKSKTMELKITKKGRNIFFAGIIIALLFLSYVTYKYNFYKSRVLALLNDESISISSINHMSSDEITTRKEIMKLKAELDATNKFLASSNSINKEIKSELKIKYSSVTFADIFKNKALQYERSHPASVNNLSDNNDSIDNASLIKNSIERQKSYKKLMEITPSGYPAEGLIVNSKRYFKGTGVAISVPYGTLIKATAIGKVKSVKKIFEGTYNIEIQHNSEKGKSIITRYLYCAKPLVSEGKEVLKGQIIGYSTFYPDSYDNILGYQVIVDNMYILP